MLPEGGGVGAFVTLQLRLNKGVMSDAWASVFDVACPVSLFLVGAGDLVQPVSTRIPIKNAIPKKLGTAHNFLPAAALIEFAA